MSNDTLAKIGLLAGLASSAAADMKDFPLIPAKYQPLVAALAAVAGAVAALYHAPPKSAQQPVNGA